MVHGPVINRELCVGCNKCVEACPMDVICPGNKRGDLPTVRYHDECWYDGGCVMVCPTEPPAIKLVHPLNMRLALRRVK
jgi:NAD-dependent dihydropyrimidine dehydrogenase PreA subunit